MKAIVTMLALLAALPARAEDLNFANLEQGTSVTALSTGAEHGLVIGASYGYVAALADRPLVLTADATIGAADGRSWRLRTGAVAPLAGNGRWNLIGSLAAIGRGTSNDLAQMIDVGTDVAVLAGRYSPRWFAAAELGFDWAIATHIAPSDEYRMLVYPDARDGWYRNTGGVFRVGVQGGASFGKNDVVLRVGMLRDIAGDPTLLPFYATLAYDRRW